MEEAAELANYLPLSFKTPKEQEYIECARLGRSNAAELAGIELAKARCEFGRCCGRGRPHSAAASIFRSPTPPRRIRVQRSDKR